MLKWSNCLRSLGGILAVAMLLSTTGCFVNMMAAPFFLFGKDPTIDPPLKLLKGRRDSKKVLVISYADNGLRFGFDSIDEDICSLAGAAIALGDKRFEVVPARKARAWRDSNPNWSDLSLQEIGEQFDVDYVMFMEVTRFSLNETKNQFLLQGSINVKVKVHDIAVDQMILDEMYQREYPPNRAVPLTDVASEEQFRRMFLATVGREISWYLVPHRAADEISEL